MSRRAGFLSVLLVVVLGLAALVGWRVRLPDPADCDRAQLIRWLVTRDLGQESFELRTRLLHRLEQEIERDPEWGRNKDLLTQDMRSRLDNNLDLLVEPWFVDKLDHYVRLPAAERTSYVDQILNRLAAMRKIGVPKDQPPTAPQRPGRLVKVLLEQWPQWEQRATPERRRAMSDFLVALQTRWLTRQVFGSATS